VEDGSSARYPAIAYDQDANFGALFCTFFVNGKSNHANCYFKDIDGNIPDNFELISKVKTQF